MIELETQQSPQIAPVEELGSYAKYEASPLPAGYGVTLGNALRGLHEALGAIGVLLKVHASLLGTGCSPRTGT